LTFEVFIYAIGDSLLNYGVFTMSKSENQVKEKKKPLVAIILVVLLLLVGVLAIGVFNNSDKSKTLDKNTEVAMDNTEINQANTASEPVAIAEFNLEQASKPRILGNIDAPIKISEHSSFTCGHCSKFHKTNFKKIKQDYVDTGKAYIVFTDFPLNGRDIEIGAVARCVPEKAYFSFIQLLFETQRDWLKEDFIGYVKQNAKLTGASEEQVNNCLNSEELHKALANQRETAMDKHNVRSTPTLVINDTIVIPGLSPYSELKKVLDAEFEKTAK